jgi:hypothetical protein
MTKFQWYKQYFLRLENLGVIIASITLHILLLVFGMELFYTGISIWFQLLIIFLLDIGVILVIRNGIKDYREKVLGFDRYMRRYFILKGWHFSLHFPMLWFGRTKEFNIKAQFTDSCRYNLETRDQDDINKLFGVSLGMFPGAHKKNSIRIGWRYDIATDEIQVFWYLHENGIIRFGYPIGFVKIDEIVKIKLIIKDREIFISMKGCDCAVSHIISKPKRGYYLFPYFGGNRTALKRTLIRMSVNK